MRHILKILLNLILGSIFCTGAWATVTVKTYQGPIAQVCQPSDNNPDCGGGGGGSVTTVAPLYGTSTIGLNYDDTSLIAPSNILEVNWPNMTTSNATGVNWNNFALLNGTQSITGTWTFNNTISGSISGNAATATNITPGGSAWYAWAMNAAGNAQGWNTIGAGHGINWEDLQNISSGLTLNWNGVNFEDIDNLTVNGSIYATTAVTGGKTYNVQECDSVYSFCAKGNGIELVDGEVLTSSSQAFSSSSANFTSADVGKVISIAFAGPLSSGGSGTNGAVSTGTPTTFTSSGASFSSSNIGQIITIAGAGTSGAQLVSQIANVNSSTSITLLTPASTTVTNAAYAYGAPSDLTTTIASYVNAHNITLTSGASTSVANVNFVYGTDDTAAFQAVLNLIATNMQGTLYAPAGIYIWNGSFQNTSAQNSQVYFPIQSCSSPISQYVVGFHGESLQTNLENTIGTISPTTQGTIIYSTIIGTNSYSADIGPQSALGASPGTGNFSCIWPDIENVSFRTVSNPQLGAVNLIWAAGANIENVNVDTAGLDAIHSVKPTGTNSEGVMLPGVNNSAFTYVKSLTVTGYYSCLNIGEHTEGTNIILGGCYQGLLDIGSNHNIHIGRMLAQQTTYPVVITGSSPIYITDLDVEHDSTPVWQETSDDLVDTGDDGSGMIGFTTSDANFYQDGGANMSLFNFNPTSSYFYLVSNFALANSSRAGLRAVNTNSGGYANVSALNSTGLNFQMVMTGSGVSSGLLTGNMGALYTNGAGGMLLENGYSGGAPIELSYNGSTDDLLINSSGVSIGVPMALSGQITLTGQDSSGGSKYVCVNSSNAIVVQSSAC